MYSSSSRDDLYLPVYDIPEFKWKEMGKHISNIVTVNPDEHVVSSFIVNGTTAKSNVITMTAGGMVKKTPLHLYNVTRYNKDNKPNILSILLSLRSKILF